VHLRVENIGKRFGKRVLFRKISFDLHGGESLAITGSNGSGKSTLVQILAGVLTPTRGQVTLQLEASSVIEPEAHPLQVGLVAPYLSVYEGFSPRENLRFLAQARRLPEAEARIQEALEQATIAYRADEPVKTFSSGMKQRVRFAAALLAQPPLLLLDEPTSNLDEAGKAMVYAIMQAQIDAKKLLIVATNDAEEAAQCQRRLSVEEQHA